MYQNYELASRGLKLLFFAEIVNLAGAFLGLIPFVGSICALVAFIMNLAGIHTAREAHPNFQWAWYAALAGIVLNVVGFFVGEEGVLAGVVTILSSLVGLALIYSICTAGADLVADKGDYEMAQKGRFVWKLNAVCVAVVVVCVLVVFVPILNILAGIAAIGTAIAAVVAGVLYIVFLYRAYQYLQA